MAYVRYDDRGGTLREKFPVPAPLAIVRQPDFAQTGRAMAIFDSTRGGIRAHNFQENAFFAPQRKTMWG